MSHASVVDVCKWLFIRCWIVQECSIVVCRIDCLSPLSLLHLSSFSARFSFAHLSLPRWDTCAAIYPCYTQTGRHSVARCIRFQCVCESWHWCVCDANMHMTLPMILIGHVSYCFACIHQHIVASCSSHLQLIYISTSFSYSVSLLIASICLHSEHTIQAHLFRDFEQQNCHISQCLRYRHAIMHHSFTASPYHTLEGIRIRRDNCSSCLCLHS